MPERIEFSKLSGSGNDFICIDNRDGRFDAMLASPARVGHFARKLCARGLGLGADGVIFACRAEVPEVADIQATLFEPDGREVELCGNGTACFTHWVSVNGWVPQKEVKILTPSGVVLGRDNEDEYVRVCIPLPQNIQTDLSLEAAGKSVHCDFMVTGTPHVITYVDDIDSADVARLGAALRHHERFKPRGANASFVQVIREGEIAVRTFEFGVEGETLACGTGSAAAAILAAARHNWPKEYTAGKRPVLIHARSGDVLRVYFARQEDGIVSDLCLETVVRFICRGELAAEFAAQALTGNCISTKQASRP